MQLDIERSQPGKNTVNSDFILKSLNDFDQKPIDTFVREGLQNCLDAHIPKIKKIHVNIDIKDCYSAPFTNLLDASTQKNLHRLKFPAKHSLLVLQDAGTTGLDGDLSPNLNSKFEKLVYTLGDGKKETGLGGSHGLGSTIFYKMGAGFVAYYSRVKNSKGHLESRFAIACIEPKEKPNITKSKNGVAWWGTNNSSGDSSPVTDPKSVKLIIEGLLGKDPYGENETGTTIIIPFFRKKEILGNEKAEIPAWERNVPDAIRMAIQRWYGNRLTESKQLPTLKIAINGKTLAQENIRPVFHELQKLKDLIHSSRKKLSNTCLRYIRDINGEWCESPTEESEPSGFLKAIKLNNTFKDSAPAGWLAVCKLNRKDLKLGPPNYNGVPHDFIFGRCDKDAKRPVIALCRRPLMIVRYDMDSWAPNSETPDGEYVIALFILNHEAELNAEGGKLEKYIGDREGATHSSWKDDAGKNIVGRIRNNVVKAVKEAFFPDEVIGADLSAGEQIRNELGRQLLPEGFGKAGSGSILPRDVEPLKIKKKKKMPSFEVLEIKHLAGKKEITLVIETAGEAILSLEIAGDAGTGFVDQKMWGTSNLPGEYPFEFTEFSTVKPDGKLIGKQHLKSELYDKTRIELRCNDKDLTQILLKAIVRTKDTTISPSIILS